MPMTRTGPRWSEPVVRRLIEKGGGKPPELLIERYADELRAEAGQHELAIRTDLIASCLGIHRAARRRVDFAGRIYADEDGQLRLDVNALDPEPRRRFTEAHELMHTAFPGFTKERRYRLDVSDERNAPNREEEHLCDLGAAALLMPRALVRDRYELRTGFAEVERLASNADVSIEAAANRLVTLSDEPVALVCFSEMHKPADQPALRRGEPVEPRLRVRYAATGLLDLYVPRFKGADDGSAPERACSRPREQRATESLPGVPAEPFDVRAKRFGDRVLALAWPRV